MNTTGKLSAAKGLKMFALALIFLTVIKECFAEMCGTWPSIKYCSDKCCEPDHDACCTYSFSSPILTHDKLGIVLGGLVSSTVGLILLIIMIVAFVRACIKSSRVVQPYHELATDVIASTGTQPGYSGPPAMYPQPSMYPTPPPAYPGPTQGAAPPPPLS